MAKLALLAAGLTLVGLMRFAFPSFREGTYRRGYLWYLRLGDREELGLTQGYRAKPPTIHTVTGIALTAAAAAGLAVVGVIAWGGGYPVVAIVAWLLTLLFAGMAIGDVRENRYLRGEKFSSSLDHPVSPQDKVAAGAVDLISRDLMATLEWDRQRARSAVEAFVEPMHALEGELESHARIHWLAERVQESVNHDRGMAWPACPLHPNHPLSKGLCSGSAIGTRWFPFPSAR
jgi:hypothetical protein